MDDAEVARVLWRSVLQHDRGIVCPAFMWERVLRVVGVADPARVLGWASAECQAALRRIYRDRPLSLQGRAEEDGLWEVVKAVEVLVLGHGRLTSDQPRRSATATVPTGVPSRTTGTAEPTG